MSILSFLGSPDGVAVLSFLGGLIGHHVVKKRRASNQAEIDRWAKNAASAAVLAARVAIQRGYNVGDTESIIDKAIAGFRVYAAARGVDVTEEHERRALEAIAEQVTAAGVKALEREMAHLAAVAAAAEARMRASIAAGGAR